MEHLIEHVKLTEIEELIAIHVRGLEDISQILNLIRFNLGSQLDHKLCILIQVNRFRCVFQMLN